ncbi:MAG: D-alanine--D-alanine ligase [Parcubacteria group bacterium]|nr:D-alanine--D-alanine ligase [Parcubacteria group bacterium]
MARTRVGVIRGGPSNEYEVSLKTGAAVLKNLPEKYEPVDIFIDKKGEWYARGVVTRPERILSHLDVAFIALHGKYGEDGQIQKLLATHRVPYVGSESLPSALGLNKHLAKEAFKKHGLRVPYHTLLRGGELNERQIVDAYRRIPQPSVVKPVDGGSSVGVYLARDFFEFKRALKNAALHSSLVLVEEFIPGTEATCGVVERFRGAAQYALPPIEIVPPRGKTFFDYEAKYGGASQELCPASFVAETKREIERMALAAHTALGLRHYSRADFIVSPRGVYILETNSLPGLTEQSLLPKACAAVGLSFPQFLDHVLTLAIRK